MPTAAGVMFTANPITGTRHETVIDASPGLGEAVVSGAVNPDHFVVNSVDRSIVMRRLGDKRMMITSRPGGGTELHELAGGSSEACLDDEQVLQLVDLGQRVQRLYGAPQDTEWALDSAGSFWLTQARPITTLYPLARTHRPGLRVLYVLELGTGSDQADHSDGHCGYSVDRHVGSHRTQNATRPAVGRPARHACRRVSGSFWTDERAA